jgi:hypothetical protein
MSLPAVIFAVIFTVWLLITIICQFSQISISKFFKRYDYFSAIPTWTFFAPNPATQDFTLMYRDQKLDGTVSSWKVFAYCPPPPQVRWIWNPEKRRPKIIHDMATSWLLLAEDNLSAEFFLLSVPYLCLLHQATVAPRGQVVSATQIAVVSVHSRYEQKPVEIMATSRFHRV